MGHQSAGFGPWHRKFLLEFEQALQIEEPDASLPYWDWTDHDGTTNNLFSDNRLGARSGPIVNGYFGYDAPGSGGNNMPRPSWWPNNLSGWRIPQNLQYGLGSGLSRRSDNRSLATENHIQIILAAPGTTTGMNLLPSFLF